MTITAATRRSSELSKHSAAVFAEAEEHPVTVTRRDGEDMVLMTQRENEARDTLLAFAAQIVTVTTDTHGTLGERMARSFNWMYALSVESREACATELVDAARASFATGQSHLAIAELTSWRETATALSAGLHSGKLEWFDDAPDVERP